MIGTNKEKFVRKAAAVMASAVMVSSMNGGLPVYAGEIGAVAAAQTETKAVVYAVYNGNGVKDKFESKRKYKIKVRVVN